MKNEVLTTKQKMRELLDQNAVSTESFRVYLNKQEAADYLGVTPRMMTRLAEERRIPFYKVGKFTRFLLVDLETFAQTGRVEAN
jgi:excisionase family DNA binding protein